jgi:hypothetical protein
MAGTGFKSQIAQKIVTAIEGVTIANGYTQDVQTVTFDKVKVNISDYADYQLPAVQIIDQSKIFEHQMSRSKSTWFLAVEICLRDTMALGEVDQQMLWDLQEDVMRSIMKEPQLGLGFVIHVKLVDEATDLHLQSPNYIAIIGLEILYYEPVTRDSC